MRWPWGRVDTGFIEETVDLSVPKVELDIKAVWEYTHIDPDTGRRFYVDEDSRRHWEVVKPGKYDTAHSFEEMTDEAFGRMSAHEAQQQHLQQTQGWSPTVWEGIELDEETNWHKSRTDKADFEARLYQRKIAAWHLDERKARKEVYAEIKTALSAARLAMADRDWKTAVSLLHPEVDPVREYSKVLWRRIRITH